MVDLFPVFPKPEANVRPRGQPRGSDVTDDLPLPNALAHGDGAPGHVEVLGFVGGVVADLDVFAVAFRVAGFGHHAIADSQNGGAGGCGVVRAVMGFGPVEDGVKTL